MTERKMYIFEYISKLSDLQEQEDESCERIQGHKKTICETETISLQDYYWTTKIAYQENNKVQIKMSRVLISDFKNKTADQLHKELLNAKEDLEQLEEELDEIDDLEEDELREYDFHSLEEYREHLEELEDNIFLLKGDIDLMEKLLKK